MSDCAKWFRVTDLGPVTVRTYYDIFIVLMSFPRGHLRQRLAMLTEFVCFELVHVDCVCKQSRPMTLRANLTRSCNY